MEKKVKNLSIHDYDFVEEMIEELLEEKYGIRKYGFDALDEGIEYIVGAINVVKLGEAPDTLKHRNRDGDAWVWSEDIAVTDSYRYADYYELDKFNELCVTTLSGSSSETYAFGEMLRKEGERMTGNSGEETHE